MPEASGYRILIIDDEESIRESLTEFFRDCDIEAMAASSAEDGLALLQHRAFDLAVIDVRLPGMHGDRFIMAAHRLHKTMKFIIHTGSVHFRITPALANIGLTDGSIIHKPVFHLEQLLTRAMELLRPEKKP